MSDFSIGKKLKNIRAEKKVTLKQLGDGVQLSASYLSQLERGKCSISINQLYKIAKFLNVNMEYFISDTNENSSSPILRNYEHDVLYIENNLSIEYKLANNIRKNIMLPKLIELLPGFSTETKHSHIGEEFIYILEGTMVLHYGRKEYVLYPGDTAYYNSETEHFWINSTNKVTKVILVCTPNLLRK